MASSTLPVLSFPHHSKPNPKPKPTSSTLNNDFDSPNQSLISLIEQCTTLNQLKQIHARIIRTGTYLDPMSSNKLLSACALSEFSSLDYARQVFDQIPHPNLFAWNTLIRAYASSPDPGESVAVFLRMLEHCSEPPNKFTYPFLVKAASELGAPRLGRGFHGMAVKSSMASDVFVLNSLIHFYGSSGDLGSARRLFSNAPRRDVVSWNSMIAAFVQGGFPDEAFGLFREMEAQGVKPNTVTMFGVLSACGKSSDLEFGRWLCSYIRRSGIAPSPNLNNAMLDMYVKCGSVRDAEELFGAMPAKDVVSWTTMLDCYARSGDYDEARRVFEAMPCRDVAAWNALISAYEQSGNPKEALSVFRRLQVSETPEPDEVTLVSALSACAQLGAVDPGRWIHVYVKRRGLRLNCHVTTSLIDMYAKCGDLGRALEVFGSARRRDVYVWSAMINGLAMHGRGRDAVDMFAEMVRAKVKPNAVTFTNVLCACSHAGLVEEGKSLFRGMEPVHGVVPGVKHYACVVDMLGRSGRLGEALDQIEKMPIPPSVSVWGALLGACRLHGNVELAERACGEMLGLDPRNHGAYVLLSNIYAKTDKWDEVSRLRKLMRDSGIKKEPGCSSIEVDGTVHEFIVGDNSHPLSRDIYAKLDEIAAKLKEAGHVSNTSHLLQFIEEEDMKEQALNLHSEKLAISFGLISTAPSQPIRVVKNLRVCGDCHSVAKLVSKIYGREILLRDRYRFHHFKGGNCSCMDYW